VTAGRRYRGQERGETRQVLPLTLILAGCVEALGKHGDEGSDGGSVRSEVKTFRSISYVPTQFLQGGGG
jgi:hypothetical protein